MGLVPFGSTKNPASYQGASGPHSKGRMPDRMSDASIEVDSGPDPSITTPAPDVDGSLRGHDTDYPRKPKQQS
jgi:hypothetical protein